MEKVGDRRRVKDSKLRGGRWYGLKYRTKWVMGTVAEFKTRARYLADCSGSVPDLVLLIVDWRGSDIGPRPWMQSMSNG